MHKLLITLLVSFNLSILAEDVLNESVDLTLSNPYGPDEYYDQFAGDIVDTILLPKKVKFSGGGKVYGKYAKQIISS